MRPVSPSALSWMLLMPALWCVGGFVVLPMVSVGIYSFWIHLPNGLVKQSFTLANWREFFSDPFYGLVLLDTIRLSLVTTLICGVLGYPVAYALILVEPKWKRFLVLLLFLPSWISYVVRTMSWLHILGTGGLVNLLLVSIGLVSEPLPLLYNDVSIYLGLVHYLLPLMILNIYIGLQFVDPNVVDAARTLGATGWQAFIAVTFPWSLPGLSAGCLLCFILSAGAYVTPKVLGGPGSSYYAGLIYDTVIPQLDWPFGATLALVFIGVLAIILVTYGRLVGLSHMFQAIK